jgi:DNA repair exonuclease SbcCD ATPase subunit
VKLLALRVGGFGGLKGDFAFDPSRVSVVVDDNERGKSTLLAAITAALYGLDGDRRAHRMMTPLERWKPWGGGEFKIELDLECGGEKYTIKRDFDRGVTEVWSDGGKDVTEKFRTGKDEYPVGKILLGLDDAEFEKCALLRQGELDQVVPSDEKVRRQSTLHARLENAADTRGGDTNATEALQVLENAASNYTEAELGTTLKVETAIQRLEMKRGMLEADLHTLQREREAVEAPMQQLLALTDEERDVRDRIARLDQERRQTLIEDLRRKLDENGMRRRELTRLREEAQALSGAARLGPDAEVELRETVTRHEDAVRNIETLEQRRKEQTVKEKQRIEAGLEELKNVAHCTLEDADRCVALASELQRIVSEDSRLRDEAFQLRDTLAGQGHLPERIQFLTGKFEGLTEDQQRVIRGQSDLALAFQTEVAELEGQRTDATETLRSIDAERHGKRLPGWVLTALGFGTGVAGVVLLTLHMQTALWAGMLATGVVAMLVGAPLLMQGANARAADREAALKRLSEAQRRLNQLRARRAEGEVSIAELSRNLGYRDAVELMRDWAEYARVMDESAPVLRAQRQMETLREQRTQAIAEVKKLLERVGGGPAEASHLEAVARQIRKASELRAQLGEIEHGWGWIQEEKRVAESQAHGLQERAMRMLEKAGLKYDPSKPWSEYLQRVADLSKGGRRLEILTQELIPAAEKRMMPEADEKELQAEIQGLESAGPVAAGVVPRPAAEVDIEHRSAREQLDDVQRRREDLRLQVEGRVQKYHQQHPEITAELERVVAAHQRALRFQRSIDLARETISSVAVETHRRWADWMNERVSELLRSFGTQVESVRFGEDLDFSIKWGNGQQATRGRAMNQLSAGARDQLHLAVRLAVSEYLSRGGASLPLLVDDAFATSDDERARAGMSLLIEHFSRRHQVILVTCHRGRHEQFAKADAKVWSDRVQLIDASANGARAN